MTSFIKLLPKLVTKVIQIRSKCIGCAVCSEMQPDLWRMSKKDGKAVLLKAEVKRDFHVLSIDDSLLDDCRKVVKACPVNIIKIC